MITGKIRQLFEPGALRIRFQPIVSTNPAGRFHAVECLTRGPRGTLFEAPSVLFDYARRKRAEVPVEREVIRLIFESVNELPKDVRISINIHASTLGRDDQFAADLARHAAQKAIDITRFIVEIVEHSPVWNQPAFLRSLIDLRALGVQIALDDVGLGNSNYRMILDSNPDYFKVDAYVCRGIDKDDRRRAVLRSIVQLAQAFGSSVVAEGIEELPEFTVVQDLGVGFVQGYLFHKPLGLRELQRAYNEPGREERTIVTSGQLLSGLEHSAELM
jgi:EAL domain-containing protein (putative c-di-GMP-specific phosphodiesterase class I)